MICPNWQYVLSLDYDLKKASRFVDIRQENFETFSIEFVRLLLAVGSEIDVVAKLLYKKINPSNSTINIDDCRKTITAKYSNFYQLKINIPQSELEFTPWEAWKNEQNPFWWKAYNEVKYQRDSHFQDANLKNTLNAIAGLFIMILCLHKEDPEREKFNQPVCFSVETYNQNFFWKNIKDYMIPCDS